MFEFKVMEPAAFKFDYIAALTQAGQSSTGMPENGCRTRRREEAESFSKKLMKVTSVAWQPHATLHATLPTELLAGAAFWSFDACKEWNENTRRFFCPDPKCCPWQHFGSVACSVACSVAWVLRVVCSVACSGCHVAYFASCSAVCRWRVKHAGGTMRRTDGGIDPLEVADGGKKFARPNIQEFLFFPSYWNFMSLGEELQRSSGQKLKDVLAIMQ